MLTKGLEGERDGQPAPQDGEPKEGEENQEADEKALAVPEKPEGYEVTFPEGTDVDQEMLTAYRAKAHELGLNQKQFQELAGLYAEKVADSYDRFQQAQFDSVDKAGLEWEEQLKARPTYEADLKYATRALAQFGSKELNEYFDVSMAGSYPPVFDAFVKIGRALAEPEIHSGKGASAEKTAAEVLYPNQGK
jgi:hypothetical protein